MREQIRINGPVLLLMGPIGLFFSRFARHLESHSIETYKVSFPLKEPGFRDNQCFNYSGGFEDARFRNFLKQIIEEKNIRQVFMYGDFIWPHKIAIDLGQELNAAGRSIETWVFELGYLRPNYVTLEKNRVNCRSNLCKGTDFYASLPPVATISEASRETGIRWRKAWKAPTFIRHSFTSYRICESEHKLQPKPSYLVAQARGFLRKYLYQYSEKSIRQRLSKSRRFFIVILQVATDSQVSLGSPYLTVENFIEDVVTSFAHHASDDLDLFIKHHPRDRGYNNYSTFIKALTRELGTSQRVHYFHDSRLAPIFQHASCAGCILINSSVGFQALFHGIPLKTLGQAPYNIEGLSDQNPLEDFWNQPQKPERELVKKFYQYTINTTQINGNFDGSFPFEDTFSFPSGLQHQPQNAANAKPQQRHQSAIILRRLGLLTIAYGYYGLHWFAYLTRKPKLSRQLFEQAAYRCLSALGVSVAMEKRKPSYSERPQIHIANHESALDVLLVHGVFRMPAATTAQLHLRFLLPGFRHAAQRYGHLLLDYRSGRSRTATLRKSSTVLKRTQRLFVFPSGSLKTTIQERFSPSIAFLAKQNDAMVHPWLIRYESAQQPSSENSKVTNPIQILINGLQGGRTLIRCLEQPPIDSRNFSSHEAMTQTMQKIYTSERQSQ